MPPLPPGARAIAAGVTAVLAASLPVSLFVWVSAAYRRFPWLSIGVGVVAALTSLSILVMTAEAPRGG